MSKTKPPAQRDTFTAQQNTLLCNTARRRNTSLDSLSSMLVLFFFFYTATPYLQRAFNALANMMLTLWKPDSSIDRALLQRILASLCAIFCSGLLYVIACNNKKKSNRYTPASLTAKIVLRQFISAVAILTLCGLFAAAIEKFYFESSTRAIEADVLKLRSSISGLIILAIDTVVLAFKEELIYRAIPGLVVSTFFTREPIKSTEDSNNGFTYSPDMYLILSAFSIPFGLAHRGLGVVLGSLLAGTAFLYLIVIKNFRWWILAIAHAVYNFFVLMTVSI